MGPFSVNYCHIYGVHIFLIYSPELKRFGPTLCAAYAGCTLTRTCNRLAFSTHKRSTTTTDMLPLVPQAFQMLFETDENCKM